MAETFVQRGEEVMANYAVTVKVFRNDKDGTSDFLLASYLSTIDSAKTIRGIGVSGSGAGNVVIVLVHDT